MAHDDNKYAAVGEHSTDSRESYHSISPSKQSSSFKQALSSFGLSLNWLFLCLGLKVISSSLTLPILPFFITDTLGASATQLGYSASAFAFAQMVGAVIFGRLSDAIGRRKVILISFGWSAIGFGCTAHSYSIEMLYLSRIITGLSGGSIAMASAMVADVTTTSERPYYNGLLGAVIGSGFVVGPALGGILYYLLGDRRLCLLAALAGTSLALVLGLWNIPETLPPHRRRSLFRRDEHCSDQLNSLMNNNDSQDLRGASTASGGVNMVGLTMMCLARLCLSMSCAVMLGAYFLLLKDNYEFVKPDREISKILTVTGTCIVFYQGFLFKRIIHYLGLHASLALGCLFQCVGIFLVWWSAVHCSLAVHVMVYCCTYAIAYAIIEPNVPTITSLYADKRHQGFAHGSVTSCRFLSSIVGPAVYGTLYETQAALPFWIATVAAFIPLLFILIAWSCGSFVNVDHEANKSGKSVSPS